MGVKKQKIKYMLQHKGGNPKYYASCYNKLRRDREDAKGYASQLPNMNAYKCGFCNYWHVGRKAWH